MRCGPRAARRTQPEHMALVVERLTVPFHGIAAAELMASILAHASLSSEQVAAFVDAHGLSAIFGLIILANHRVWARAHALCRTAPTLRRRGTAANMVLDACPVAHVEPPWIRSKTRGCRRWPT